MFLILMAAIKGEFTINSSCCFFFFFFFFFFFVVVFFVFFYLFIYLFLDLDVYVLYQCSFGIFYAIKVVSFYLYFIYLKNMGKIFHVTFFEYMIFISKF